MPDKDPDLKAWLALNPTQPFRILSLPTPLILQILSSLDLPDLASVAATRDPLLASLAADMVLHRDRLRAVGPSCIGPHLAKRPHRLELAKSGKLRGLNLESKIRRGCYLASPSSLTTFENSLLISKKIIAEKLNKALARRPVRLELLSLNLIDEELINCSNLLAPVVRRLKRELAKDLLARQMRCPGTLDNPTGEPVEPSAELSETRPIGCWISFQRAIQHNANGPLWRDESNESVRLALCPSVRKNIRFFEGLCEA